MSFQRVDPRPVKPPQLGLLASADLVVAGSDTELVDQGSAPGGVELPPKDVRWAAGFSYRPMKCGGATIITPTDTLPTADTDESTIDVTPFVVVGSDSRSTYGSATPRLSAEAYERARLDLIACEQKQIEKELFAGALTTAKGTGNRFLADSHVDLIEGDRLIGTRTAFAPLEQAINAGTCGGQGMIHARADTVTFWIADRLVSRVGNLLLSEQGTIVVAGAGYDGRAPAAGTLTLDPNHAGRVPSTDSSWAYATSIVAVRRGAIYNDLQQLLPSSTSGATSDLLVSYAQRAAAATWGCLQVGVHVDHLNTTTTTGS